MARDAFLERYRHPFLLAEIPEAAVELGEFQTSGLSAAETVRALSPAARPNGREGFVFPLIKRDVNTFADMITVGRAANNDVRLNVPSVSKFHAYFVHARSADAWLLVDAGSSNGTFVGAERLKPSSAGEKARFPVKTQDFIRFGQVVVARFLDAAGLHAALCLPSPVPRT
ncbi:FHA domain-containing protein [bacterium]|nr:FHA domain-containing protein [bacterium]